MFHNVIFDLDGTLLNTIDDLADAANWVCTVNGWPTFSVEEYKYMVGNGIPMLCQRFSPEAARSPGQLAGTVAQFSARYAAHKEDKTCPYPGIPELLQALGCAVGDTICVSGGVCRSDVWLKIRASILNRRLAVPKVAEAAMGAALLAAVGETGSIASAAESMIQFERAVEPDAELARRYGEIYSQFLRELAHLQSGGDR